MPQNAVAIADFRQHHRHINFGSIEILGFWPLFIDQIELNPHAYIRLIKSIRSNLLQLQIVFDVQFSYI